MPMAIVALLFANPTGGATICPFALITGTACPGCGLTRATLALGRGDMGAAMAFHPLVLVVLAWLVGAWAVAVAKRSGYRINLNQKLIDRLLWATAALLLVTWVIRLTAGTLPPV